MRTVKEADRFGRDDLVYRSALDAPFRVYGLSHDGERFRRLPRDTARQTSEAVACLATNTAGGRVRFASDSTYVAIHAETDGVSKMGHFSPLGAAGFDLYADDRYAGSFVPPYDQTDGYDAILSFETAETRQFTINLPLYTNVKALWIGLQRGAHLEAPAEYAHTKPIVYYGSSITQGGCASRPGLSYQSILARALDTDYVNLGFSGACRAEPAMVSYLAGLEMSVFVCDYDHNAPDPEYLAATHEPLVQAVRRAQPELPILLMSRPKFTLNEEERQRLRIIERTFDHMRAAGDRHVAMLDGPTLMAPAGNEGTVDDCHPNDLGFFAMANALAPVLRRLLS